MLSRSLKVVDGESIRLSQAFEVSLSSEDESSLEKIPKRFRLKPSLNVVIDDASKGDLINLSVSFDKAKAVEKDQDDYYLALLEPGEKLRIDVESEPYDHRWSATIRLEVEEAGEK
jgi:hypothetical protein